MQTTGSQLCSREKSILQPMAQLLERRAILPLSSTTNMRCLEFRVLAQLPLYCNNATAVLTAHSPTCPGLKAHLCADYDIAAEVRNNKKGVPNLNGSWVKAHQDNETPIADLTFDTVLNCADNKDAESFQLTASTYLQPKLAPPELPLTKAYL
eukprot:14615683-Ditylum_brightwellii.AAC.1